MDTYPGKTLTPACRLGWTAVPGPAKLSAIENNRVIKIGKHTEK